MHFGYDDKLWLIVGESNEFDKDPYGTHVRSRYNELSTILENKYEKADIMHTLDQKLYKSPDEFLAGIKNGRSKYFSKGLT